jgi:hypothetical protein
MLLNLLFVLFLPTLALAQEQILINKEGRDIQTLAANVGPRLHFHVSDAFGPGDLRISPRDCDVRSAEYFDCTEALRWELGRSLGYETVVFLRPLLLKAEEDRSFPKGVSCSLIELRTLIRRAIWENKTFEGIGFYADGTLSFLEKSQLLVQKDAFLLVNNEPVIVHTVMDVGLCQSAEAVQENYAFKAFVQFTGPAAEQATRVWESKPVDYRLSLQPGQRGFDRTLEIIRP